MREVSVCEYESRVWEIEGKTSSRLHIPTGWKFWSLNSQRSNLFRNKVICERMSPMQKWQQMAEADCVCTSDNANNQAIHVHQICLKINPTALSLCCGKINIWFGVPICRRTKGEEAPGWWSAARARSTFAFLTLGWWFSFTSGAWKLQAPLAPI